MYDLIKWKNRFNQAGNIYNGPSKNIFCETILNCSRYLFSRLTYYRFFENYLAMRILKPKNKQLFLNFCRKNWFPYLNLLINNNFIYLITNRQPTWKKKNLIWIRTNILTITLKNNRLKFFCMVSNKVFENKNQYRQQKNNNTISVFFYPFDLSFKTKLMSLKRDSQILQLKFFLQHKA